MKEFESFVYKESDLLDQRDLNGWLELLHDDVVYWIPIDESADPVLDSSIVWDNKVRLQMRVDQIVNQNRVSQAPPSETLRMITNLQTSMVDDVYHASYKQLLVESREGDWRQAGLGHTRYYPGRVKIEAVRDGGDFRLIRKEIILLGRHRPFEGLSFIL
ncbi:MAG TPA: aromatic-ring-hydroxylating dioxygenase subunit beta [Marinobacter sp.]|nr:aromatic-ring-hydroxylating dioxygenase subunit beta [Marinobacter sp.]